VKIGTVGYYTTYWVIGCGIVLAISLDVLHRSAVSFGRAWIGLSLLVMVAVVLVVRYAGWAERMVKIVRTSGAYTVDSGYKKGGISDQFIRFDVADRMFTHLRQDFRLTGSDILDRVSVAFPDNRGENWQLRQYEREYQLRAAMNDDSDRNAANLSAPSDCLLVLWDRRFTGGTVSPDSASKIAEAMFTSNVPHLGAEISGPVLLKGPYAFVPFNNKHRTCPRTFANKMIWSEDEWKTEARFKSAAIDKPLAFIDEERPGTIFIATAVGGREKTRYILKAKIKLRVEDGIIAATLWSVQLKGGRTLTSTMLSGFWEPLILEGSKLIFTETSSGAVYEQDIYAGALGLEPLVSPWRAMPVELPQGLYRVTFKARNIRSAWFRSHPNHLIGTAGAGPVSIRITGTFVVK
jgi:hypothetical protein